jgi:hypothetical protein
VQDFTFLYVTLAGVWSSLDTARGMQYTKRGSRELPALLLIGINLQYF